MVVASAIRRSASRLLEWTLYFLAFFAIGLLHYGGYVSLHLRIASDVSHVRGAVHLIVFSLTLAWAYWVNRVRVAGPTCA
jgi:hypothetical protein